MINKQLYIKFYVFLVAGIIWVPLSVNASFDRNLLKETESKAVPVTEELLTREGEPGPATPTFKLDDTSKFLVEVPYDKVHEEEVKEEKTETKHWWDDWFSWGENDKENEPK